MKAQRIEGADALVTGANRGIGRALTEALLTRGARKVYAIASRGGVRDSRRHRGRSGGHLSGPVRGGVWPIIRVLAESLGTADLRNGGCHAIALCRVSDEGNER
jgi:NAD(P)-dependent dehydrogenase (short-subunit alcohol dehydrogenase family)